MSNKETKGSFIALLPLIVFVLLFIGAGVITKDFSAMPLNIAALIASIVALAMNRKEKLTDKIDVFTKGAGDSNIILMVLIFILAGAFAETAAGMGAVESTVNMGLAFIPGDLLMVNGRLIYSRLFYFCFHGNFDGNGSRTSPDRNWIC